MKNTVFILSRNHLDNTWRRCWDRPFKHEGKLFVDYVTIERALIDAHLKIAKKSRKYCFEVESSRILRRYIEDHPKALPVLRKMWNEGRFDTTASGEVIPDTNMPRGETLVRNLTEGIWWTEEVFGHRPKVGFLNDAFGCSAQLPQIFANCNLRWLFQLCYKRPSLEYWKGLDGTISFIGDLPSEWVSDVVKYPPCPSCNGRGCKKCDGYGTYVTRRLKTGKWFDELKKTAGYLLFTGEEVLPPVDLPAAVAAHKSKVEYKFGIINDLLPFVSEKLAACDNPPKKQISPEPDGNPTMSGILTGRIELKRRHRFIESILSAAEVWRALGGPEAKIVPTDIPRTQTGNTGKIAPWEKNVKNQSGELPSIRNLWRDLVFTAFHDALPATHVDPAYVELMDTYSHIEDACAAHLRSDSNGKKDTVLFNSTAKNGGVREIWPLTKIPEGTLAISINGRNIPVIERSNSLEGTPRLWANIPLMPVGATTPIKIVKTKPAKTKILSNKILNWKGSRLAFKADFNGITELLLDGKRVAMRQQWGVGEILVEKEIGDPWVTREFGDQRFGTRQFATRTCASITGDITEIVYTGKRVASDTGYSPYDEMTLWFNWIQRWRFYKDQPYADLKTEINWSGYNRFVRLAFPTGWKTNSMNTEIPFGVISRDRYEMNKKRWSDGNGDWAAVSWASIEHKGAGLAVINRGTPAYRCEDGVLMNSLLRSPTFPHCLEEDCYSTPVYDGMRDAGRHIFEHRIFPYFGSWNQAGVVEQAEAFNTPLVLTAGRGTNVNFTGIPQGVTVAAIKPAICGEETVIRLSEMTGKKQAFNLEVTGIIINRASRTNLLEDFQSALTVQNNKVFIELRPWEILTLKLAK